MKKKGTPHTYLGDIDDNATCNDADTKALEYKDKLIEYCEVFKKFFKINKKIYMSLPSIVSRHEKSNFDIDTITYPVTYVAIALIPSPIHLANQFKNANIIFDATVDIAVEDKRIKKIIRACRNKRNITDDYYVYLRNYISLMQNAQYIDEIMLSYSPQYGMERLEFLVDIVSKMTRILSLLDKRGTSPKKIDFIKEFCKLYNDHDDKPYPAEKISTALVDISSIAQNMYNCVFPGIYTLDGVKKWWSLFYCEPYPMNKTNKKLNNIFQRMIPDRKIIFYNLINKNKEQSFRDASLNKHITNIFSNEQIGIIKAAVCEFGKDSSRYIQDNMLMCICIMIYKNYKRLSWSQISLVDMSHKTCLRQYKICKDIGIIKKLRADLQGEPLAGKNLSAFLP